MMTNPLKEDYKKGNRWCERGLENLGEERERERERVSDMREQKREK